MDQVTRVKNYWNLTIGHFKLTCHKDPPLKEQHTVVVSGLGHLTVNLPAVASAHVLVDFAAAVTIVDVLKRVYSTEHKQ
ncbi:hypothetical protein J6590_045944 [Homalodisca vitripennis]|nr:hypothetical protein J6590_045944 [Homalodisca vitripennis]